VVVTAAITKMARVAAAATKAKAKAKARVITRATASKHTIN